MVKKKYKVVRTPQFQEDLKKMPLEDRKKVEEAIKQIAENPLIGEPSKPCPKCGKYFFHSDKVCPFCGFNLKRDL